MKFKILFVALLVAQTMCAQRYGEQIQPPKRYTEKEVLDSIEGIKMYTPLISALGGDSITYNRSGYNLQGWNEDFYTSGKLLHRGYYINGQLITFKNFFESGQCERAVINPDPLHCDVHIFFQNGNQRREVNYYNGLPQKRYEFYENGLPKYAEENEKEMKYLTLKKSWYVNGNPESTLELVDVKAKKYRQKNYYANGQVKEEGNVLLLTDTADYVKDGTWYSYDSDGKNKHAEKHSQRATAGSKQ